MVRHPGTGRLMWATRLPFGYIDSPRLFCGLTEALVGRVRSAVAGKGIHFYVFVDDILCVGDTEELTREGCRALEDEFRARGVKWAPNKTRGPCQCIEFWGLLLVNGAERKGVTITRKRVAATRQRSRFPIRRARFQCVHPPNELPLAVGLRAPQPEAPPPVCPDRRATERLRT